MGVIPRLGRGAVSRLFWGLGIDVSANDLRGLGGLLLNDDWTGSWGLLLNDDWARSWGLHDDWLLGSCHLLRRIVMTWSIVAWRDYYASHVE